ncbi:Zn-dependent hydrolase [Zeaxanthinibacter enoshimensis]|uniref:N-carbamoyl-L-amino-acid hydrolase n=1 Tax=Zeaxanthinibacter enoshimensis TaxID=392009 RepID=A0A4R6TR44_9FLAO|nr:Zn-dependent hydrolase [Zeaxanthinibacter enoshimensis]TDQ30970.1 N-carbamoyl-L-amino-acid hydrolase [Zeaxanthinibacter enoshimensis]
MKRHLLSWLIISLLYSPLFAQSGLQVNQERLEEQLKTLATYGQREDGTTNRVAFSEADIKGRAYVMQLMRDAGLEVHIDAAANIIGRKPGTEKKLKPLSTGSHIDMVPDGGNYDGIVGSLAAIEVVKTLQENNIRTRHPLEVIIFSNEEGGVMGSRALAGKLGKDALKVRNSTGYSMAEGIQRLGGDTTRLGEVIRKKGDLAAFLELHIEQGGILDQNDEDIGVVEGIVGIKWWEVVIRGKANHAGTTPMDQRADALLSAAHFIIAVNDVALANEGKHVCTVGRIVAKPGAPNVIPGEVILSLEIRDLSMEKMDMLYGQIKDKATDIENKIGTTFTISPIDGTGDPALTDPEIRELIRSTATKLGLSHRHMQSGAGHDAQDMALLAPTGMIFVPSKDGISHSPAEYSSPEDIANGANVLLHTLLQLDQGQ